MFQKNKLIQNFINFAFYLSCHSLVKNIWDNKQEFKKVR